MTSRGALLLLAVALAGCSGLDETTRDSIEHVATLRSGTVSELKAMRGRGPFRTYDVAPGDMLEVLAEAARRARGKGGHPVTAVFVSARRGEMVAKERPPEEADDDGYAAPFLSAVVATVHPIAGAPGRSRVELHATHSGPFHRGAIDWAQTLPGLVDGVLAERQPGGRLRRLP